jgi:hypothetical protein
MSQLRIAIDFDGTIVDHRYPGIGQDAPTAIYWLKRWKEAGAILILWTMRSGFQLEDAVDYCRLNGIIFDGINEGPNDRNWTTSPKAYAHIYVDDAAFGCPLKPGPAPDSRPWVDWDIVGPAVMAKIMAKL